MGHRFYSERIEKAHASPFSIWGSNAGTGKYYKRRLNKLLRRFYKGNEKHLRGIPTAMCNVNYKMW
jgi:hypothetical protein